MLVKVLERDGSRDQVDMLDGREIELRIQVLFFYNK